MTAHNHGTEDGPWPTLSKIHDALIEGRARPAWRDQSVDAAWDYSQGIADAFKALYRAGMIK
jgi:hypothetical protein